MESDTLTDTGIRRGDEYVREGFRGPVAPVVASRSFRVMDDKSTMPFGAFVGQPIGEVPASYLDRLRDANWLDGRYPAVAEYIERHSKVIDMELEKADRARERRY
jgi:hypothetical protein